MRTTGVTRATRQITTATAPSATPTTQYRNRPWQSGQQQQAKRPCLPFQKGQCTQPKNHQSAQGFVVHACAYCLSTVNRAYNHQESDCRRKTQLPKEAKNDEQA